jgi:glutaryl-CoA dehydrogenase
VSLETTARRVGSDWVLDGSKRWTGNGSIADVVVVLARSEEDGQVNRFLVEKGSRAFNATTKKGKGAVRAMWQADVVLEGGRLPEESRLPGAERFADAGRVLITTRTTCAWAALGHAVAAYDTALTYAKQRRQFGRPLSSFQIVQDRLVKMLAEVTGMQLYCMQLARLEGSGRLTDTIAVWPSSTTPERPDWSSPRPETCGRPRHPPREPHHPPYGDIEVIHTYEGTETMQTLIVGRDITGVGAYT